MRGVPGVVPPGDRSLWKTDPFKLVRVNDRLIGRGVEDNGQAIVASIFALRTIKDLGLRPSRDVSLFLVSDEASWISGAVLPVDGGLTAGMGRMARDLQGD